jgi:predicted  nucleic acid-binding Zn-ribbon protein
MRDLSLLKTRESFKKLVDRKDREISELKDKTERLSRIANAGLNNTNSLRLKDLERQVLNLNKQIEIYRSKIATLSINKNSQKNESESKDDARKYLSVMQQLKNNLDILRKENERMHMKASRDQAEINLLKSEKTQFERQVSETPNDGDWSSKNENDKLPRNVLELKKLRIQNQTLETQVRDSSLKISNLENKLAEATKSQKATSSASEDGSKVRVTQLENSLKKLTQDLIDVRTQLAEVKKESNKLRQEKTALQNQVDRLAKDNAKGKFGAKKGKVA